MKLKFQTSKIANFFFYVSNLSEWHYSCRKEYNKIYTKITSKLNKEEKDKLKTFKEILQKYDFYFDKKGKPKYLGQYFLSSKSKKEAFDKLKKAITKKEFEEIKEVFIVFGKKFEKLWKYYQVNNKKSLDNFKKRLERKNYKYLLKDTERIFLGEELNEEINIVIIYSPLNSKDTAAGGANAGKNNITIELPKLRNGTWQQIYSIMLLFHEVAHIMFEKRNGRKLIEKEMIKNKLPKKIKGMPMQTVSFINEIMTSAFLPKGYLGQKYSNFKLSSMLLGNLNRGYNIKERLKKGENISYSSNIYNYFIWQLYPLSIDYGRNKKKIDKYYIQKICDLIKELK
jgi:hypothetical protein